MVLLRREARSRWDSTPKAGFRTLKSKVAPRRPMALLCAPNMGVCGALCPVHSALCAVPACGSRAEACSRRAREASLWR